MHESDETTKRTEKQIYQGKQRIMKNQSHAGERKNCIEKEITE